MTKSSSAQSRIFSFTTSQNDLEPVDLKRSWAFFCHSQSIKTVVQLSFDIAKQYYDSGLNVLDR